MAQQHPELAVTFLKGMIKVGAGPTSTSTPQPRSLISRRSIGTLRIRTKVSGSLTWYPEPVATEPCFCGDREELHAEPRLYQNDFDVSEWAAPQFLEQAAKELLEQQWKKVTGDKLPDATELLAKTPRMG